MIKKNSKPWCTATLHPWPSQYTRGFSAQPLSSAQTQHPPTISRIFFRGILWFNELWWIFCWLKDELALLTQPPFILFFLDLWQPFFFGFLRPLFRVQRVDFHSHNPAILFTNLVVGLFVISFLGCRSSPSTSISSQSLEKTSRNLL